MQRFVLQQDIQRCEEALRTETDPALVALIHGRLLATKRELALLSAARAGVRLGPPPAAPLMEDSGALGEYLKDAFERSQEAWMLLDAGPGLTILDINPTYAAITMRTRSEVVGRPLFEAFPDNPSEPRADGVANLYGSLKIASETGKPHTMPVQRYDIRDEGGAWVERWWQPLNIPVFDMEMRLAYLLHQVSRVDPPT